ncbi:RuBisCO accumulation factor 1 [Altericista sp. CCNU0014]|uniref:RuBisCO accumulation factor 1 n=1 Tax=Altericista sp. CCNU0014 TaxID=3082949 RepID=UPI00384CEED0
MTEPLTPPADDAVNAETLFLMLRRKQGSWVEWGQACQQLQKAGYSPQAIFEETGFEPIQQNQVIVAAQVYKGLEQANTDPATLEHFGHRGSDILYELRVFTQPERPAIATFAFQHKFDSDEAHDLVRTLKDFARVKKPPEAFTNHPGDAVAHQSWVQAKQKSDLQERSRLIAKGLKFAHSDSARKEIEKLLTDFSVTKAQPHPRLPLSRPDSELDLPRILPLLGKLPLPADALRAVPSIEEEGPFHAVKFAGEGAWVPLPGWQVIASAEDAVAVLSDGDRLPIPPDQASEEVLVVIDRAQRDWDDRSYFAVDAGGELDIQWFAEAPTEKILGRVVVVVRPKRIFDEEATKELWVLDE